MAAGIFHVYTHSVWAAPSLFHDEIDYTTFLRELARTTARTEWDCIAFCAIDTHYHLIVEVDDGVLPKGMHALNFRYAMQFNGRHAMKGHVMGARYDAVRIDDEDHLVAAFRYVVRNPLAAGLRNAPQDWPWCSYSGSVGLDEPHSFVDAARVIACFGEERSTAVARLRAFVEES
jgi:putative transposase